MNLKKLIMHRAFFCNRNSMRWGSPVRWARLGIVSVLLAKALKTAKPTILVLSLPRSGSSWVGEILGSASDALYLREPLTQSNLFAEESDTSVIAVDPVSPPEKYRYFADTAFTGLPVFHKGIVRNANQWSLLRRWHRRLVIKEVNPLACRWLTESYSPRVILLVRHPAAVALSYLRLSWVNMDIEEPLLAIRRLAGDSVEHWEQKLVSVSGFWEYQGIRQGAVLRIALGSLSTYPDYKIVLYEELCDRPMKVFRDLFDFCGLSWDRKIEAAVINKSSRGDSAKPYSTSRDSKSMINSWRGQIGNQDLLRLKDGYTRFDLPWYRYAENW